MKVKIAVVQFKIKQFSPEENLKKAEEFVKAASGKADVIIFPEYFIFGPLFGKVEYADGEKIYCKHFQKLAKKYKIDIVPGSIIERRKNGVYNTTYYIDSRGRIKGEYRKINLWHPERRYISPGNKVSVFNTKFGKVGLIICWDLAFPEIFRAMARKGVNIVFCPSLWSMNDCGIGSKYNKNSEIVFVDSACISRAFENEIIMVFCNSAGRIKFGKYELIYIGHSQITMPFIGVVKRLNHNREEMFIQEVDTNILKDAERAYKIKKDVKNFV